MDSFLQTLRDELEEELKIRELSPARLEAYRRAFKDSDAFLDLRRLKERVEVLKKDLLRRRRRCYRLASSGEGIPSGFAKELERSAGELGGYWRMLRRLYQWLGMRDQYEEETHAYWAFDEGDL